MLNDLRAQGLNVESYHDWFRRPEGEKEVDDSLWLVPVSQKGWISFTRDLRYRYNRLTHIRACEAKARIFQFTAKNLRGNEMAPIILAAMPRIRRFLKKYQAPFIAKITRGGGVEMVEEDPGTSAPSTAPAVEEPGRPSAEA